MHTEPLPDDTIICGRCATACDGDDSFCRQCGMALQDSQLPSVRESAGLPALWQPRLRALAVKSAAFIAAGALAEALARRMARRALAPWSGERRRPASRRNHVITTTEESPQEGQIVSDTVLLRHIRIRR